MDMNICCKFSYAQLKEALYNICFKDSNDEAKKQSLEILSCVTENKEIGTWQALVTFIRNEDEDLMVRKYASATLLECIEHKNALISSIMHIFLKHMEVPEKRASMQKGFFIFIKIIAEEVHEPEGDNSCFIVSLMMKCLNTDNDAQLHELGAIILHALLKNMTIQMTLHVKNIAEGLQILLEKSKSALKNEPKKSYVLFFHTLMSATILGQHMSKTSLIFQPFRESLEDILNLLKYIAAHGTANHFNEVSEVLKILLKHKQLTGLKWMQTLQACESICRNKKYKNFARIKTLEIFGNTLSLRRIYFQRKKNFHGMLVTVIGILCQEPSCKSNEPKVPTPISAAADLLQFISNKFPREELSDSFIKILLSAVKSPLNALNEWQFAGIFISLARIVKSCGCCLNTKYSKELIIIFKAGFQDISMNVRQAAVYALQKLFIFFFDECGYWVKQIFPDFLKNITLFISDFKDGRKHHPLHVERLFATMKTFFDLLENDLILQLPCLMNIFQHILEHIKQVRVIILTIQMLQETAYYTRSAFFKYFNELIIRLEPFMTSWENPKYDDIRSCIVELLTNIMMFSSPDYTKIDNHIITQLIFNMLQLQHSLTKANGANLDFLLKYSPLRCSIFRFFDEISNIYAEKLLQFTPKLVGTLLGTITAIKFISQEELEHVAINKRRLQLTDNASSDGLKVATYFTISDNNETEIANFSVTYESYTLYDEIFVALIALQNMKQNCPSVMLPYTKDIFLKLAGVLKHSYPKLRKQILYTLNSILLSFFEDNQPADFTFLDQSIIETVRFIKIEMDFTTLGECVLSFLYYVAIKEKHTQLDFKVHIYFMNLMSEIFHVVISQPQEGEQRRAKDFLLSQIIAFLPKFSMMVNPMRFNNYFGIFLCIFEAKIHMPLYRSPISDQKRSQALKILIKLFLLMDKNEAENFKRISYIFAKCLNDPVNQVRENAAEGLGMLASHCNPQPVVLYKQIVNILWKRSKREKSDAVLDCIWYGMALTINRNIWQQPIRKLSMQLISLLPIRHKFEYNMIMVEFFDKICLERPEYIAHVIKDIYKYLLEILESGLEADIDPLYKSTLALASKLYSMHIEDLQHISIKPLIMESLMCAYKNKTYIKAALR